ncbi:hypothetical protein OCUBac02_02210 [Bosea sp. ANAM02]|nr:hypothetical protein OCUBac02_02210 [Bosea sp. ANAM02]
MKAHCPTFKGVAGQGVALGQTELAPPPYRPPFRGAVRVGQERSSGVAAEQAGRLAQLAAQIERLSVSHRDPEAFFIERSEIANELRVVSRNIVARSRVPVPANLAGQAGREGLPVTGVLDAKVRT